MNYAFYGEHQEVNYHAHIADYYGSKIPSIVENISTVSWEEFFRKDNLSGKIEDGQWVDINDESFYIKRIRYDVVEDVYKCYTNKVLSVKSGNKTREMAKKKLEAMQNKGASGFFNRLFGV